MSEIVELFGTNLSDLDTSTPLGGNTQVYARVKIPVGNAPAEYPDLQAITLGQLMAIVNDLGAQKAILADYAFTTLQKANEAIARADVDRNSTVQITSDPVQANNGLYIYETTLEKSTKETVVIAELFGAVQNLRDEVSRINSIANTISTPPNWSDQFLVAYTGETQRAFNTRINNSVATLMATSNKNTIDYINYQGTIQTQLSSLNNTIIALSNSRGQPNGIVPIDLNSKIPIQYFRTSGAVNNSDSTTLATAAAARTLYNQAVGVARINRATSTITAVVNLRTLPIAANARRTIISLDGVSTNGTSALVMQTESSVDGIGFTTQPIVTGMAVRSQGGNSAVTTVVNTTAGTPLATAIAANSNLFGNIIITRITLTSYSIEGMVIDSVNGLFFHCYASVNVPSGSQLRAVTFRPSVGTESLDAGVFRLVSETEQV